MITKFEIFENIDEIKRYDFVVTSPKFTYDAIGMFMRNKVGKVNYINSDSQGKKYHISYKFSQEEKDNIPKDIFCTLEIYFSGTILRMMLYKNEILYWSKNREDCELFIQSNKFNI